jgi:hypothetical protein
MPVRIIRLKRRTTVVAIEGIVPTHRGKEARPKKGVLKANDRVARVRVAKVRVARVNVARVRADVGLINKAPSNEAARIAVNGGIDMNAGKTAIEPASQPRDRGPSPLSRRRR